MGEKARSIDIFSSLTKTPQHIGGCQIALNMRFFLFRRYTKHLDFHQRLNGILGSITSFSTPITTIWTFLITPFWMFTLLPLTTAATPEHLRLLLRLQCANAVIIWLREITDISCNWISSCHSLKGRAYLVTPLFYRGYDTSLDTAATIWGKTDVFHTKRNTSRRITRAQ